MKSFFAVIGALFSIALMVLFVPFLSFWLAYFGGWVTSLVIGDILANGLNTLFNVSYFSKDMIPLCAATLGWIGGFFKAKNIKFNQED